MALRHHVLAVSVALFTPVTGHASGIDGFSDFFVFGDSLSDPGNVFNLALGAPVTPLPGIYDNGQLTDGDTWAVQLGADFASGTNFAFGTARATTAGAFDLDLPFGTISIDPPDLPEQIAGFVAAVATGTISVGSNPLAAISIGGNDLRDAIGSSDPAAIITGAITSIATSVQALLFSGVQKVVVLGLPNLALVPEIAKLGAGTAAFAQIATVDFNTSLSATLDTLFPPNVSFFDTFGLFQEIVATPEAFGIANTTEACLDFLLIGIVPDCDSFLFYDNLHPTSTAHAILADRFAAELKPIPLPATGLLLIAALGLMGLRRKFV